MLTEGCFVSGSIASHAYASWLEAQSADDVKEDPGGVSRAYRNTILNGRYVNAEP